MSFASRHLAALLISFFILAAPMLCSALERLFVLPMELETDRGATNGDATLLRLTPGYNWVLGEAWEVVNLDIVLLANAPAGVPGTIVNPEPVPGGRARGLSDVLHASFISRVRKGEGFTWGAGFLASFPTATEPALGSGKWSIGPALRGFWNRGPWHIGAFGGQRWSFAGNRDRANISQLMFRGTFIYEPGQWFLVSAPIVTANWNAESGNRWLVPLGGGFGRKFRFTGEQWRVSLQFYTHAVKPAGAPDWSARLALTAVIPL